MKTRTLKDFILKALLIISEITFGFASFNNCDAQSIVGKWHRTGTTQFRIDKATGKQTPLFTAERRNNTTRQLMQMNIMSSLNLNQIIPI